MKKKPILARALHKWFALIVGVQALLWFISGAYMTIVPLEIIHADHLVHAHAEPLGNSTQWPGMQTLKREFAPYDSLQIVRLLDRDVAKITASGKTAMVDLASGKVITPVSRDMVSRLAAAAYTGKAKVKDVKWITEAPQEVAKRPVPMWAVTFNDLSATTFYFSPETGDMLARRHRLWRIFDFVWMFHIMDYENRTDVHNNLLRVAISLGLLMTLAGAWLLLYSFNGRKRQ